MPWCSTRAGLVQFEGGFVLGVDGVRLACSKSWHEVGGQTLYSLYFLVRKSLSVYVWLLNGC